MKRALHASPRADVLEHLRSLFKVFTEGFERRQNVNTWDDDEVRHIFVNSIGVLSNFPGKAEAQSIIAFLELVVKLNEAAFRPLFRKMFDWAFAGKNAGERGVHVTSRISLIDIFKKEHTSEHSRSAVSTRHYWTTSRA